MKKLLMSLLILLILPLILAVSVQVEKQSSEEVLIIGLDKPVIFNLEIKNKGPTDNFQFYNLFGFNMFPKGTVQIGNGETKDIKLEISPIGKIESRGYYNFQYYIRGQDNSEQREELIFKIVDLEDVFEVGTQEINPDTNSLEVYIENKVNLDFEEINAEFSSSFFNFKKEFPLNSKEKKTFEIDLNKEDFKKLTAGFYTLNAKIKIGDKETNVQGTIKFAEKDLIVTSEKDSGFIISTEVIEKSNEGNTITKSETIVKKNILSRLFTSFSPEPDFVEREGVNVYYTWSQNIKPGETLKITIKTNWLFPLLAILFIVIIVVLVKQYSGITLGLRKKVSFVKAKGGEFALKVSVFIHAKKYIERVNLVERLPPLTKIYHRFGGEEPSKIDEKNRRLEWNFEKLEAGETRVVSYIIYSKIGVLGRFALPPATAFFEKDGEIKETESNRAFFVTEQKGEIVEEDKQ